MQVRNLEAQKSLAGQASLQGLENLEDLEGLGNLGTLKFQSLVFIDNLDSLESAAEMPSTALFGHGVVESGPTFGPDIWFLVVFSGISRVHTFSSSTT